MGKKLFSTMGMTVCVLFIIMGFITIRRNNSCSTVSRSGLYDSGLATFGTDYYTYSNNNAAEAASAARTTANNIRELYNLLADMFGWSFVFMGLIGFCHFGVIRAECCTSPKNDVSIAKEAFPAIGESYINPDTENNIP